jgi:hypothetical protein
MTYDVLMKKTISHKVIHGKDYYYLNYRKNGRLHSDYLGKADGPLFKKYLLSLISEKADAPRQLASREAFKAGVPVVYVENNLLIYEYKNGTKQAFDKRLKPVPLEMSHGK